MKQICGVLYILTAISNISALASPLNVTGSSGALSFSALFENIGNGFLEITLTNTGEVSPSNESGVIGALFFHINGDPTLTPMSMSLGLGSSIVNGSGDPSQNWRYDTGLNGPAGATQGVSAAGYGLFGSRGNFCSGANCGNLLQGIDWGLVNASYVAGSGNASIAGEPLIRDTAVFVLSGISLGFDPSVDVNDVNVQFTATLTSSLSVTGTDPPGVPEPSAYWLIGTGMIIVSLIMRKTAVRNGGKMARA